MRKNALYILIFSVSLLVSFCVSYFGDWKSQQPENTPKTRVEHRSIGDMIRKDVEADKLIGLFRENIGIDGQC